MKRMAASFTIAARNNELTNAESVTATQHPHHGKAAKGNPGGVGEPEQIELVGGGE